MWLIKILIYVVLLTVAILSVVYFIKKCIIPIINGIKEYKKMDNDTREKSEMLMIILTAPIILWILDALNIFSILIPYYDNITREYDWLSFVGTYSGAIVSAILLIFITEKDRKENTKVIREAQRPYLDVCFMKIKKDFFDNKEKNAFYFDHGSTKDKKIEKDDYLTLCIKNNGASVAIIDINKTEIILEYIHSSEKVQKQMFLNTSITRLSIKSGEEVYIKFHNDNLYKNGKLDLESKILKSKIFYKDLFNKIYVDECELRDNLIVLRDNEQIDN